MPESTDLAQEKQRLAERLAKLEAERERLQRQIDELAIAQRVLARFEGRGPGRRGRRAAAPEGARTAPRRASGRRRRAGRQSSALPLGEATLRGVQAHPEGVSAEDLRAYLARELEVQVRPNHLGMALQRHRRAGRLALRGSLWHAAAAGGEPESPG